MSQVHLLVPAYPPFTLRSSMIDRDPVIWVHLLENYIQLFDYLLDGNFKHLSVKSKQLVYEFFKRYVHETYDEENKIFSLGSINVDIKKNESELKVLVFQTIKVYSLLKFNLIGESIWDFICIYVDKNNSTVRALVDGTYKSKFNDNKKSGNISSISSVQAYLESKIMNGKFTKKDLECLSMLLGQSISTKTKMSLGSGKSEKVVNKKKSIEFAEKFVDENWIKILEKIYANGKGVNAPIAKDIMIVSLVSLPSSPIAKLATKVGITSPSLVVLSPLFISVVILPEFQGLVAGVEEKLGFLVPKYQVEGDVPAASAEDIANLTSIFPDLGDEKANAILQQNNNDVEHVINTLLEDPGLIDRIEVPKPKPTKKPQPKIGVNKIDSETSKRFGSDNYKAIGAKSKYGHIKVNGIDEKLKQATLNLAMTMMEEGETDAEVQEEFEKYFTKGEIAETGPSAYLRAVYDSEGIKPFEPESKTRTIRKYMREQTGWSDSAIEDWGKQMQIKENSKRNNSKQNSPASVPKSDKSKEKRDHKYNDKHKASKANHNRKSQHSKKGRLDTAGMRE